MHPELMGNKVFALTLGVIGPARILLLLEQTSAADNSVSMRMRKNIAIK